MSPFHPFHICVCELVLDGSFTSVSFLPPTLKLTVQRWRWSCHLNTLSLFIHLNFGDISCRRVSLTRWNFACGAQIAQIFNLEELKLHDGNSAQLSARDRIQLVSKILSFSILNHPSCQLTPAFPCPLGGGQSVGGASGQMVVTAIHPYAGQQPGDLSFAPGDRITVITKSDSQYDWWEGQLDDGRVGIFPANFVTYWPLPPAVLTLELQLGSIQRCQMINLLGW